MKSSELDRLLDERKIPSLLLLHGAEGFLLERALARLIEAAVPPECRDFNLQIFRGREVRAAAVIDAAVTLPVFAPRRLLLLKEIEEIPGTEMEALIPYLGNPSPDTVLVLVGEKIDGRRKFYQGFRKHGQVVEFRRLYENQIPSFIQEQARSAGHSLTDEALALFCRRVGNSLQEVHGELVKLFSYLGEEKLADVAHVAAVVSDSRADSIFDLVNAIGGRRIDEALRLLERLLDEGMAPLLILAMLTRHFRQLWMARELLDRGVPTREIAAKIKVSPYFLEGLLGQARRISPACCRHAFDRFLEVDLALKSSGGHPPALLQGLILALG